MVAGSGTLTRPMNSCGPTPGAPPAAPTGPDRPDASRKFEGRGIQGDLTSVVGGATAEEKPKRPEEKPEAGQPGEHTSSLLAAKRRAREQMNKKDEE